MNPSAFSCRIGTRMCHGLTLSEVLAYIFKGCVIKKYIPLNIRSKLIVARCPPLRAHRRKGWIHLVWLRSLKFNACKLSAHFRLAKRRLGQVKWVVGGHVTRRWQSWHSSSGLSACWTGHVHRPRHQVVMRTVWRGCWWWAAGEESEQLVLYLLL